MRQRIPRSQYLEWLATFYSFMGISTGASVGRSFQSTFEIGDDPDLHQNDDAEVLDIIEKRYVAQDVQ